MKTVIRHVFHSNSRFGAGVFWGQNTTLYYIIIVLGDFHDGTMVGIFRVGFTYRQILQIIS